MLTSTTHQFSIINYRLVKGPDIVSYLYEFRIAIAYKTAVSLLTNPTPYGSTVRDFVNEDRSKNVVFGKITCNKCVKSNYFSYYSERSMLFCKSESDSERLMPYKLYYGVFEYLYLVSRIALFELFSTLIL